MNQVRIQERSAVRPKATIPTVQPVIQVPRRLKAKSENEQAKALYEWQAAEHTHRPKSPGWYMALAAGTTAVVAIFLFMANFMAAVVVGLAGGLIYYLAQRHPATVRYRLLADGLAINNAFYQYRDLKFFNIIYEPGEVKTVLLHGKQRLAPLLHLEIGDADPQAIADILVQHITHNQDLEEPLVDLWARHLGF